MFALTSAIVLAALASKALADPSPLTPVTSNVGGNCVISWTPDATSKWTQVGRHLNPVTERGPPLTATCSSFRILD